MEQRSLVLQRSITPSLEDLVLGVMRVGHERGVRSYPLFNDESWHLLLFGVKELLSHLLPPSICIEFDEAPPFYKVRGRDDISFALSIAAVMDFNTQRMWLNREDDFGSEFAGEFSWLGEEVLDLARRIEDFLEY